MSSIFPTRTRKALAAAALVATTGLSVAACGSTSDTAAPRRPLRSSRPPSRS